jgi:flagellin
MTALGASLSTKGNGNLYGLSASDPTIAWQSAFMKLSSDIDRAINKLSTQRAVYGSQLNSIGFTKDNLSSQSSAFQVSKSAIMDTNFALETANFAKSQIMQNTGAAVAAQANQIPNAVINLLGKSFTNNYDINNFAY